MLGKPSAGLEEPMSRDTRMEERPQPEDDGARLAAADIVHTMDDVAKVGRLPLGAERLRALPRILLCQCCRTYVLLPGLLGAAMLGSASPFALRAACCD